MTQCPAPKRLRRLLEGQLSATEQEAVEAHIEGCPQCEKACEDILAGNFTDIADRIDLLIDHPPEPRGEAPAPPTTPAPTRQEEAKDIAIAFPEPPTARGPLGRLESYHIIQELGRGGFAFVFKAHDEG